MPEAIKIGQYYDATYGTLWKDGTYFPRGTRVLSAARWSIFSSLPQPLVAIPAFALVESFRGVLPLGLGFGAGAMIALVVVELLPESRSHGLGWPQLAAWSGSAFAVMLALLLWLG